MFGKNIKKIFQFEFFSGFILIFTVLSTVIIANSHLNSYYKELININIFPNIIKFTIADFINDFLMAIFFLLIGIDLKKEILFGELSTKARASLPIIAAVGGVFFPIVIFYFFNYNLESHLSGFAIPTATDIAFAFGVVAIFGNKISVSSRVFIISLAVVDDIIAITMIALFYSESIKFSYFLIAVIANILIYFFNIKFLKSNQEGSKLLILCNVLFFIITWCLVLKSGVHSTISGILFAIFLPMQYKKSVSQNNTKSFAEKKNDIENYLRNNKTFILQIVKTITPMVNYIILPLFVFANSAIDLQSFESKFLFNPLFLGIFLGLFIGKQLGVMLFSYLAIRLKFSNLPRDCDWLEFYGISILAGIGFTMSIFIANLSFISEQLLNISKIAIFLASASSMLFGVLVLVFNNYYRVKYD